MSAPIVETLGAGYGTGVVTPIVEEWRKTIVTRNSLVKLHDSSKCKHQGKGLMMLQRCKKHGDPLVNVAVKSLHGETFTSRVRKENKRHSSTIGVTTPVP